ncbi:MAG: aspartate aminotransferase family protein [Gammaproteobacteria bacterium]|nr:aspartate aminotransferase family protein [Gammaproteobacteria bacterium]
MNAKQSYLMPTYTRQNVSFVRGEGARLWDEQGREYLDAIAGVAVTNLGHANPEITAVISQQASLLLHTSNMFGIPWQEQLAQKLCSLAGMERAFFCNSGAEANEAALKIARLHARVRNIANPQIVVMSNSFHGRTLATLAATDNRNVQQGFEPLMGGFIRVPYNEIEALRDLVSNKSIVAVLLEPVQGEGGVHCASPTYLSAVRQLCDKQDWLLMMDEVQTGMGRTGQWFGFQHADITPDVITLAKGLGNGFPIGACLAHGKAAQLFAAGSHASTFGGNPLGCRIACQVIDIMQRDLIPQKAAQLGQQLLADLCQKLKDHPNVLAIRGIGLMVGIELNYPAIDLVSRALIEQRLLITITRKQTIRLLPALICTAEQVDDIVFRISRLLATC